MFSEEEIREFKEDGLTDEQIEMLDQAMAWKETVDLLPDDIESFIRKYEQKIPEDAIEGMRETFALAQSEPEFFKQIVALDLVMAGEVEDEPVKPAEKTIITNLPKEEYETVSKNFFKILANLSDTDRKEFLKLIANLTEEQKEDMVSRLNKE
ncbi:MAG: hypothetical protein IKJ33_01180 [Clostridia bacterium]|nr:hypothetical protein [Clostridia bacterium]